MDADQIAQLCHPDRFDHAVSSIQLIETHISWVILTGEFVYKIKKPVDFGFLDFSTLENREFCCREEVRLNHRVAPNLYLDVVPVRYQDGHVRLFGAGKVVDFAVKMRQFDPRALLVNQLEAGSVTLDDFSRLGYRIGAFHQKVEIAGSQSAWGEAAAIEQPMQENFLQILARLHTDEDKGRVTRQRHFAADMFAQLNLVFCRRKAAGFVRELHGDLHAGNIALIDGEWLPFDGIEFNPNLRWIDTASDIAFLMMDLECRGYQQHANRFLNAYLEYTSDYQLVRVLDFYKHYRAMVRAKVAVLRGQQAASGENVAGQLQDFEGYLHFCEALQHRHSPALVMVMGVSGSGKSTTARKIAERHGAIHLRSDVIRKHLFGLLPDQASTPQMRGEIYSRQASVKTFSRMEVLASELLEAGSSVVVDATFIRRSARAPFIALAKNLGVPMAIVKCEADPDELERRIIIRLQEGIDASEADVQVMRDQLRHVEALSEEERRLVVNVGALV